MKIMENASQKETEQNDSLLCMGTPLLALTLFYAILFQVLTLNIETTEFWKQSLIFILLLITFYFSGLIYFRSQRNVSPAVRAAGFFIGIFWIAVYFFLNKVVLSMMHYYSSSFSDLVSSSVSFGLGWLLAIPLFLFPAVSILITSKLFKSLKQKSGYWAISVTISLAFYLYVKNPDFLLKKTLSVITSITFPWLQILLLGVSMGLVISLIVAPVFPLLYEIIKFGSDLILKKKE